jgi:hypothetical protein
MFSGMDRNVVSFSHKLRKDTVYWCDACDFRLCVECFLLLFIQS